MKRYADMTRGEIDKIIMIGGNKKERLNREIAEHLRSLDLSSRALDIIADTPIDAMSDAFAGLLTADDVETFIEEYYKDE